MSTTDQGTEYGLFVRNIYRALYDKDGMEDLKISHDVKFAGKSGATHQIDLYWEYSFAGVRNRMAVECKDYKNKVTKEKISAFKGVLDDIGGGIRGIYACKNGYQKGAKQFAEAYGIQLMEIRHPTDADWEGRMRDIHIDIHMFTIANPNVKFTIDGKWMRVNYPDEKLITEFCEKTDEVYIEDTSNNTVINMLDIINRLPRSEKGTGFIYECEYSDAYIVSKKYRYKLSKLEFRYDVHESIDTVPLYGDKLVKSIVLNTLEEKMQTVFNDGRIVDRED